MNILDVEPKASLLKPNGHGGYIVSASSLISWARCQLQKYYEDRGRLNPEAPQGEHLSITTYGSVMHLALHVMERAHNEGHEDALEQALRTFLYYWQPANLEQIELKITVWLPRQTWEGLRDRGVAALTDAYDLLRKDDAHLLALEYPFAVPLEINGRLHTLHGYIDRLTIKKHLRKPYISVDDFKSGKKPVYLRHHTQFTVYCYATTVPEFWSGWDDSGVEDLENFDPELIGRIETSFASWGYRLHSGSPSHGETEMPLAARRGRWINVNEAGFSDAGWRTTRDYQRMAMAIEAYVAAREAGIYSVSVSGENCTYCAFRKDVCGGIGLPHEDEGAP